MEETIRTVHGENFAEPKAQIGNGLNGISECDGRGEGLDSFLEATRDRSPKDDRRSFVPFTSLRVLWMTWK
jgi:hypothetical protein